MSCDVSTLGKSLPENRRGASLVDRLYLFFPPFDSSEDAFGVSGPDEGFGIGVGFFDEPVDCSLKVGNRSEHSTLEAPSREFGEEAFDGVEPGRRGRREVKRPAGCRASHFCTLGCLWVA